MDFDTPTQTVSEHWADLESDLEATAEELDEAGWTTLRLHAGDVTTLPESDPPGFDVLVPGNEFEVLESTMSDGIDFQETAVYRRAAGGVAFLLFVLRDPDRKRAVLVPAYYPQRGDDARELADHALDAGVVNLLVRPLKRDRIVTFAIDDPTLVFPDDWT